MDFQSNSASYINTFPHNRKPFEGKRETILSAID